MEILKTIVTAWRNNSVFNRIIRNSSWLLSGQVVASILSLAQVIVITRILGTSQYGMLALIIAYVSIVYELLDSRLWETIIRYVPLFQEDNDNARAIATIKLCYIVDFGMAFLAAIVLMATAELAATLFIKDVNQTQWLLLYALWPLLAAPDETASAIVRLADRFDWLTYRSIVVALIKLAGMLLVGLMGGGIGMVILVLLVASGVGTVIILFMAHKSMKILELDFGKRTPISLLKNHFKELFQFTLLNNLTATSQMLTNRIDIIVLGLFSTTAAVGVYELAKRIVMQFNILANPIYSAIYPEISKLIAKREFDTLRRVQSQVSKHILLLVVPICIGITITSPWFIPTIFGEEFRTSVPIVQIMIWQLLWLFFVWFQAFMLAIGYAKQNTIIIWCSAIFYVVFLIVLVPIFGIVGAAVSVLFQKLIWMTLAFTTSRKILTDEGLALHGKLK